MNLTETQWKLLGLMWEVRGSSWRAVGASQHRCADLLVAGGLAEHVRDGRTNRRYAISEAGRTLLAFRSVLKTTTGRT